MNDSAFSVVADESGVTARSVRRLQFEPKGEMLGFRSELRNALLQFRLEPGQHLRVEYTPADDRSDGWVDLENVALYNVGMSSFAHLLDNGISCQRLDPNGAIHRLAYSGAKDWAQRDVGGRLVARLNGSLREFPRSVSEWWHAFRQMDVQAEKRLREGEPFSLLVVVSAYQPEGWLGPRLKPLLDGLVSALHAHDGSSREILEPRLDHVLGGQNWQLLTDPSDSVLPQRRLLRPHGENFAWNPADDLCGGFDVRIAVGMPEITAVILSWQTMEPPSR